ncbi:MAG: polysaccharide deacetylase family protein [Tumebacillaceae bacterium]
MKRGSVFVLLLVSLLLSLATVVKAAPERTAIFVAYNDQMLTFPDVQPDVRNDTTYLPVYRLADAFGGQLVWNPSSNVATLSKGTRSVLLDLNRNLMQDPQGTAQPSDLYVKSNRTMVPYRAISTAFGLETTYIPQGPIARVKDSSAKLSDSELYAKYKDYIADIRKNEQPPAPKPQPAPAPEPDKVAYLTFDDGPNQYTSSILTTLQNNNVLATFFMLEPGIEAHPDLVKWMKNDGHTLALHGVTHDANLIYRTPQTVVDEMEADNNELTKVTGVRSSIVRVPYGSIPWMPKSYRDVLANAGYHLWDWNIDSTDSSSNSVTADTIYSEVKQQVQGKKTAVILMHDKKATSEALPRIISYLKEQGYVFKKIYGSTKPVNFWDDER